MDRSMIKLASLSFCRDPACSVINGKHSIIEVSRVSLSTSKAIAISYTWGEFDRKRVEIGHDKEGNICTIELGDEWDTREFRNKLTRLCTKNGKIEGREHAACWIDQLCISQKDEAEVRETLANIPSIYKTLSVVVLMPGGICKCLKNIPRRNGVMGEEQMLPIMSTRCMLNKVGMCSYFDRVWTRQEFMYSKSIRLERTCDYEIPCVTSADQAESLTGYSRELFRKLVAGGHNKDYSFTQALIPVGMFLKETYTALMYFFFFNRYVSDANYSIPSHAVVDFLLGNPLQKPPMSDSLDFRNLAGKSEAEATNSLPHDEYFRLHLFFRHLADLGRHPRKATRAEDYVTSVWVDCPGYIIPKDFKTRGLPGLLEDAIMQLERNHNASLHVGCLGLFGSILWRPTRYLEPSGNIRSMGQIYDVVWGFPRRIPVTISGAHTAIPLWLDMSKNYPPLSKRAKEYSSLFANQSSQEAAKSLYTVRQNWPLALSSKMSRCRVERAVEGYAFAEKGTQRKWTTASNYEESYLIATTMLGLDSEYCQSQRLQLKLVVSLLDPPAIGLMKPSYNSYRLEDLVTIAANTPEKDHNQKYFGTHLLEGLKKPVEGGRIDVEVIGVWVPVLELGSFAPGGRVVGLGFADNLQNSFLVDSSSD